MNKRRAYILIFVLGITTVVTALGLSYISSNGTVMQQATNRYAAVRAQYLAESGAALATHFVSYPPTTVAYNGVYSGATGVAIDSSFDTVDITVTPTMPANRYVISATSVVRNSLGTESLAKQSVSCEAIIPPEPKWKISQALLSTGSPTVSSGVSISGSVHSNGSVIGLGTCTGAVSASGTALWTGGGPPTSVQSLQAGVSAPPVSAVLYTSYKVNNTPYTAYTGFSANDLKSADVAALNSAVNAGGNNPGRIVVLPSGEARIRESLSFVGTLVVRGSLRVDAPDVQLQSVANYPALIVVGDIYQGGDGTSIKINGPVLCSGKITDDGRKSCQITINGAVISSDSISCTGSGSTINLVWNSTNSTFWNLAKTASPEPVTVLKWTEN